MVIIQLSSVEAIRKWNNSKCNGIQGTQTDCGHHGHDDLALTTQSHSPSGPAQGTKGLPPVCGSMARDSEPILLSPLPSLRPTAGPRYDLEQGPGSPESGDPSDGALWPLRSVHKAGERRDRAHFQGGWRI